VAAARLDFTQNLVYGYIRYGIVELRAHIPQRRDASIIEL
jgi:hypothetical protein